jgi:hypothetical protein
MSVIRKFLSATSHLFVRQLAAPHASEINPAPPDNGKRKLLNNNNVDATHSVRQIESVVLLARANLHVWDLWLRQSDTRRSLFVRISRPDR